MDLLTKENSLVVLVDVQEKITPLVEEAKLLVDNCQWVLELCQQLAVPVLVTEQYPQGLGPTVEPLNVHLQNVSRYSKVAFSVMSDPECAKALLAFNKQQVVVIGIETSVCILQTVMHLLQANKDVFVVVDAVSARHVSDHHLALQRMQQAGAQLISKEMVLFEWLRQAGTAQFKTISQRFMK